MLKPKMLPKDQKSPNIMLDHLGRLHKPVCLMSVAACSCALRNDPQTFNLFQNLWNPLKLISGFLSGYKIIQNPSMISIGYAAASYISSFPSPTLALYG